MPATGRTGERMLNVIIEEIKKYDADTALVLSAIRFLEKAKDKDEEGWFVCQVKELEELLKLSRHNQAKAIDKASDIIEVSMRGIPAKRCLRWR